MQTGNQVGFVRIAAGEVRAMDDEFGVEFRCLEERISMGSACSTVPGISDYQSAKKQVLQAVSYISTRVPNPGTALFAFPFGVLSEYLVREYLPNFQAEHKLTAAFSTEPAIIHRESNRWSLSPLCFWLSLEKSGGRRGFA